LAADLRRGEGLLRGGPARKPGWPNLDGKLTEDAFAVAELTEGTVCCTLLGELQPALHEIVVNYQPDLVVLEMSGAANPIGSDPGLPRRITLTVTSMRCISLSGQGLLRGKSGQRCLSPGDTVLVLPHDERQFLNTGRDPLRFLCAIPLPSQPAK
jgi:hypothetical protein